MFFIAFWGYHITIGVQNLRQGKRLWNKENSLFYKDGSGKFDINSIYGLVGRAVGSIFAMGCTYYISISSINANLSPSIAMSFVSMTMFNVAILFYFLYGERLTKKVFIGMFLVLISMVIISLEKANEHNNST